MQTLHTGLHWCPHVFVFYMPLNWGLCTDIRILCFNRGRISLSYSQILVHSVKWVSGWLIRVGLFLSYNNFDVISHSPGKSPPPPLPLMLSPPPPVMLSPLPTVRLGLLVTPIDPATRRPSFLHLFIDIYYPLTSRVSLGAWWWTGKIKIWQGSMRRYRF